MRREAIEGLALLLSNPAVYVYQAVIPKRTEVLVERRGNYSAMHVARSRLSSPTSTRCGSTVSCGHD